ncbi:hypothetical protein [Laspinema palackyanum]|uniref:hypothetical protein n=1 Tax=Laspinema palackyanum TaxID=3231601 RepID=UPI00345DE8A6|nr:hypothetical protein [Laspinema sp. D2c]
MNKTSTILSIGGITEFFSQFQAVKENSWVMQFHRGPTQGDSQKPNGKVSNGSSRISSRIHHRRSVTQSCQTLMRSLPDYHRLSQSIDQE